MKITLVFPRGHLDHDLLFRPFQVVQAIKHLVPSGLLGPLWGYTSNLLPPLGLFRLAAATPPGIDVNIIDERLHSIDFTNKANLYGISTVTKTATRAYELADQLRTSGTKVVLGGPHVSVMPEEALKHADAVVVGEGEYTWPQLVEDACCGNLKPVYEASKPTNPKDMPVIDFNKMNSAAYAPIHMLETTRGCPYNCSFCSIESMWGRGFRKRTTEDILKELSSHTTRLIYFVSDNLCADREYAEDLFHAILPLKLNWAGFTMVSAALDTEFVDLAVASGCKMLFLGFDSLSTDSLSEIHKQGTNNTSAYKTAIRNLHDRGIVVIGGFLVGFDHDERSTFDEIVDFVETNQVECANINIVVPYPGTELYNRFEREGRILHRDWSYYDSGASYVVFQPANMSPNDLRIQHLKAKSRLYSYPSILRRLRNIRSPIQAALALQYNLGIRYIHQQSLLERIKPDTQRHY